ncbi:MAG TPA: transcriptional regulator [Campylobacterales bacterium]|nr:transcriptional regulator [Campylobacterales bacterium]
MENQEGNLIKDTCKNLGLTYRELGEKIGYSEGNLKTSVSKNQVSKQLETSIKLYLKNIELQKEIDNTKNFKKILKDFIKD